MKIECDKCGAKYSIADDKVRGKTFKIRCKKCSNVIIVRDKAGGADDGGDAPSDEPGWHLAIGGGLMAKFALSGHYPGLWLHPHAIAGGAAMALATCVVAVLWYAPVVSYLMLASAWAPRAPFLWAVLPPVAAAVLEAVVLRTSYVRDLVMERLFGLYAAFGERRPDGQPDRGDVNGLAELAERLGEVDWQARVLEFLRSPDLWAGVVVAALLLAAAMWVRRYRDETS